MLTSRSGCSLPCCLWISQVRQHWRRHLATIPGESCLRRFMPGCVRSYISTAAVKLTHQVTASSPPSTGRRERCAVPVPSAIRCDRSILKYGAAFHTGECQLVGNDIAGIAVHTGARVAALAAPGEVLVSQTVRDLVAGSGLVLEKYGTYTLKGVPDEWRLFRAGD
jgi:class 3 adenylate cyclase